MQKTRIFPKEEACRGQAGQQLPVIWESGFSPQIHDRRGHGAVVPAGSLGMPEPDASSSTLLQAGSSGDTAGALIWGLLGIQIQMSCFVDKHSPDLLLSWGGVLMERKGFQQ